MSAPGAAPKKAKAGPKAKPQHPGFTVMVTEAIVALKERNGSSLAAIKKYVGDKYKGKLPANWEKLLSVHLRRLSDKGQLVKVKASYKLGEALKKPAKKKAAPKKKATPKKKAAGEKPAKKKVAKKPAGDKPKPKKAAAPKKKAATPKKKAAAPKVKKPATKKAPAKKKAAPKKPAAAKKA